MSLALPGRAMIASGGTVGRATSVRRLPRLLGVRNDFSVPARAWRACGVTIGRRPRTGTFWDLVSICFEACSGAVVFRVCRGVAVVIGRRGV